MSEQTAHEFAEQVTALLERQRTSMARSVLRDALKAFPDNTRLLLQAAWVDYMEDKMEAALATAKSILAREPDNSGAKQLMLELHIDAGQLVDAENVAIELLRESPENAHLYGRYAHVMLQALKLEKATALANEGLRYEPGDRECLAVRTMCDFVQHGRGEASPALQKLLVEHPQSIRALYFVVIALEQRGDNRQAHQLAREMLRAQPSNPSLVQLVQHFHARTHWSMLPLVPLQKYGWGASIGLWLGGFIAVRALSRYSPMGATVLSLTILVYVIYSWVWPPLFRKFFLKE
jgi:predicted Zn-dependent protease